MALEVRANFDDFRGDLSTGVVGAGGDGVDLDNLPYRLQSSRPAVLPKSQKKILDVGIFSPVENFARQVSSRLLSSSGREVWNARELLAPLPAEQYFLVVLARQPDDYRFLHTLDSIWWPQGSIEDRGTQAHYRLLLPSVTVAAPLPSHALYWTSTAALLWDGVDPNLLTPAQQQALVDWLHWGGQLIVSGPDSLDAARATFLDGFLPAAPGASWELSAEALEPLSRMSPDAARPLPVRESWTGQHLILEGRNAHVLAETSDHEPLVAERRVGRGRTVVTAFRLAQRALIDWSGYDAVFNAALLRRPAHRFAKSVEDRVGVTWADGVEHDPTRVSQLRYFTRDVGRPIVQPPAPDQMPWRYGFVRPPIVTSSDPFNPETGEFASQHRVGPGVAAWDDFSRASDSAREILKKAAGIQVPRRTFVASLLAVYVLVLVPLNWLLFRFLGRIEVAWVAAPIVAVVFGILVARLAQLDIGFARSATEVAVLEVQGDYPRGHLTRYWALYTSLSSEYTLAMANPTAVAIPFATGTGVQARQTRGTVILRQVPESGASGKAPVHLAQLEVASNSTGMVHSEEMFDLGGSIELSSAPNRGWRLRNGTGVRCAQRRSSARIADCRWVRWRRETKRHSASTTICLGRTPPPTGAHLPRQGPTRIGLRSMHNRWENWPCRRPPRAKYASWPGPTTSCPASRSPRPPIRRAASRSWSLICDTPRRVRSNWTSTPGHKWRKPCPKIVTTASPRRHRPIKAAESTANQPRRPMIELTNFGKTYGDYVAVESLNLKIEAGELFGFIGPNGAGKSTTIRFLATLLNATHGEGTVNGHSVTRDPLAVRRSVGYMPDNFGVYDGMKVWEFLDFFAVAYQIPRTRRRQVIGDVLELLDLTHKRDDFVNGLSRGMKQRCAWPKRWYTTRRC